MSGYSIAELKRWATLRCAHCGHRFRLKRDPRNAFSSKSGEVYHNSCISFIQYRRTATERLEVLSLALEVSHVTANDVKQVAELRPGTEDERIAISNKAWRVFHDLDKLRGEV